MVPTHMLFSFTKGNPAFVTIWMNQEAIRLSEINQTQNTNHHLNEESKSQTHGSRE